MLDLLLLIPLILGSLGEARDDAKNRVDTWDLKRICTTNREWPAEEQAALRAELATLPTNSVIRGKLAPDWLRMRDGNRVCRGEKVPTK
jgi:hypothetical protein